MSSNDANPQTGAPETPTAAFTDDFRHLGSQMVIVRHRDETGNESHTHRLPLAPVRGEAVVADLDTTYASYFLDSVLTDEYRNWCRSDTVSCGLKARGEVHSSSSEIQPWNVAVVSDISFQLSNLKGGQATLMPGLTLLRAEDERGSPMLKWWPHLFHAPHMAEGEVPLALSTAEDNTIAEWGNAPIVAVQRTTNPDDMTRILH